MKSEEEIRAKAESMRANKVQSPRKLGYVCALEWVLEDEEQIKLIKRLCKERADAVDKQILKALDKSLKAKEKNCGNCKLFNNCTFYIPPDKDNYCSYWEPRE